jgi:hypothetical protein
MREAFLDLVILRRSAPFRDGRGIRRARCPTDVSAKVANIISKSNRPFATYSPVNLEA